MLRDQNGKILFEENGNVLRHYPNNYDKRALFWNAKRVIVKSSLEQKSEKQIIGFKYTSGPERIIYDDVTYEADKIEDYSEEIQTELNKIDITTNCFGYIFCDGLFWIDPLLDCHLYKIPVIENILESDNYKEIISPEPNSIALFNKDNNFWHVSKTADGKKWYGKNGIKKPSEENLEDNIKQFGEVKFYKRIIL